MIAGLCESPLTFQAITIWRDELLDEDILLRDVIDLEATFGTQLGDEQGARGRWSRRRRRRSPRGAARSRARRGGPELDADGNEIVARGGGATTTTSANLSLAAMESALKPRVLETLERIARDFATLSEMQDARMSATLNEDASFSAADEEGYQKLRSEIVVLVNSLHLHNNRIDALIDQLYGINQRDHDASTRPW